ncbi:MAG: hypothetical protein ACN2B6_12225 [Rickettsiales bacterium]
MKKLILAALIAVSTQAAADTKLYLGGWSSHINPPGPRNETHSAVIVSHNNIVAGSFVNSFNEQGSIVGYDFSHSFKYADVGVMTGAIFGYEEWMLVDSVMEDLLIGDVLPSVVPHVDLNILPYVNPAVLWMGDAVALTISVSW